MSLPDVLKRGDDFLSEYPRNSKIWHLFSYGTTIFTVGISKFILNTMYNVELNNFERLETALEKSRKEERGLMTIMNHMSVVDDPFIWAVFPWKIYRDLNDIRWCLGAHNVCFTNKFVSTYFSLGQVLSTKRFGAGPFQGSVDAMIRLLSPDSTLDNLQVKGCFSTTTLNYHYKMQKPAWVHVYPEGFVLQLQPPFSNSMRYFKWGITRMVLEATRPPIVVPIFTTGFEKIAPEDTAESPIDRYLPNNFGTKVTVTVGNILADKLIDSYREEWKQLVDKYSDPKNPTDLSDELKYGKEAQDLRCRVAAFLREQVAIVRNNECGFPEEDSRFKSPSWWRNYTKTEGASDPDVEFIGKNWAIRSLQNLTEEEEALSKEDRPPTP